MSGRKPRGEPPPPPPSFRNDALREAVGRWKQSGRAPTPPAAPIKAPPPRPPPAARPLDDLDGDALFRAVMDDVAPIAPVRIARPHEPDLEKVSEDAEALARLAELVATGEGINLSGTGESFEGLAQGVDASLLVRLRRGDFRVEARVELKGLGTDAANAQLERFLGDSRRRGHRCVLVGHGGDSPSTDRLASLLARGRLSRMVLAFAPARPVDGGAGALYVLLRR